MATDTTFPKNGSALVKATWYAEQGNTTQAALWTSLAQAEAGHRTADEIAKLRRELAEQGRRRSRGF